jgi:thioesterase domain-containing protein
MEVIRRVLRQKPGHRLAFARRMMGNKFGIGRWQGSVDEEEASAGKRPPEIQAIIDANYKAAASYVPRPYRGRVILFQATIIYDHMYLRNAPDPRNGWDRVFRGDFQVVPFDCQHHELFQEPVHPDVCRHLDRLLNEQERPFR